jgi:hypothetical protein
MRPFSSVMESFSFTAAGTLVAALALFACQTANDLGGNDPLHDGGVSLGDASADASADASVDALAPAAHGVDGALACAAVLARMLAGSVVPPNSYASLNLATGANPKGLTFDEANASGCFTLDPVTPNGFRTAHIGSDQISITYNMESHVILQVSVDKTYVGALTFQSRPGGAFGAHTYVIKMGSLLRDGVDFPINWALTPNPALNELYDGLIATFGSGPAVTDCEAVRTCLLAADGGDGNAYFGVRSLAFYMTFEIGTNKMNGFYNFHGGGDADCSTPIARAEVMDNAQVYGPTRSSIGTLKLSAKGASQSGMTYQEADAILCHGGTPVTAPDANYSALQWGTSHEIVLEYNTTTNVAYKLYAVAGYKGILAASSLDRANQYQMAINVAATKNGAPFAIDWANPASSVTELSNAVNTFLGTQTVNDANCLTAGSCVVTPDDGANHSIVTFKSAAITVLFAKGTSTPQSFIVTWSGGM